MKKMIAFLTVLAIVFGLSVTAFAAYDRLDDKTGALSESEQAEIAAKLDDVSGQLGADVVVVTVNDSILAGKTEEEYADDYYDSRLYAEDGVILVVNTESNKAWISTSGEGIEAFTDYGIQECASRIGPYMTNGDYAAAFHGFADTAKEFFETERNGTPINIDPEPVYPEPERTPATFGNVLLTIVIAFVIAFLISLIITAVMKGQMKSVASAVDADTYVDSSQCRITGSRDRFLYHTVSVVPLPRVENRQGPGSMGGGRPGGGGSTTHVSSSGHTHGGGGFSF